MTIDFLREAFRRKKNGVCLFPLVIQHLNYATVTLFQAPFPKHKILELWTETYMVASLNAMYTVHSHQIQRGNGGWICKALLTYPTARDFGLWIQRLRRVDEVNARNIRYMRKCLVFWAVNDFTLLRLHTLRHYLNNVVHLMNASHSTVYTHSSSHTFYRRW